MAELFQKEWREGGRSETACKTKRILTSPAPSERKDNTFEKYVLLSRRESALSWKIVYTLCTLKIVWRQCLRRPRPTYIGTCSTGRGSGTGGSCPGGGGVIGLQPPTVTPGG